MPFGLTAQGAEARVYDGTLAGIPCIVKQRFSKTYRHPVLDNRLTTRRTILEARTLGRLRELGIPCPALLLLDKVNNKLYIEKIEPATTVKDYLFTGRSPAEVSQLADDMGILIARMHKHNIVHGDLTTSNILRRSDSGVLVAIDFGLTTTSTLAEDKAVDLYVMERALISTHAEAPELTAGILSAYTAEAGAEGAAVLKQLKAVRARGRKMTMLG